MWCIKFVTCNVWIYPRALHIICHLAHRRMYGTHMWSIKFVTRNISMYPPALHIICHLAHRRFVQCGWFSATLVYYVPRTQAPHVCPTLREPPVRQVVHDWYIAHTDTTCVPYLNAHSFDTTCVPRTLHFGVYTWVGMCVSFSNLIHVDMPYIGVALPISFIHEHAADDMECVKIHWYVACHELNTSHVWHHSCHEPYHLPRAHVCRKSHSNIWHIYMY